MTVTNFQIRDRFCGFADSSASKAWSDMYTVDRVGFVVASCIALTMLYEKRTLMV